MGEVPINKEVQTRLTHYNPLYYTVQLRYPDYSHLHRCPASYDTECDHTQSDTLQAQLLPTNSLLLFCFTLLYLHTFKLVQTNQWVSPSIHKDKDIASLTTHSNTFKLTNEIHNSRPAYTKTNNPDSTTDKYEHVVFPPTAKHI